MSKGAHHHQVDAALNRKRLVSVLAAGHYCCVLCYGGG
jgi:hypothetical protein